MGMRVAVSRGRGELAALRARPPNPLSFLPVEGGTSYRFPSVRRDLLAYVRFSL